VIEEERLGLVSLYIGFSSTVIDTVVNSKTEPAVLKSFNVFGVK